MSEFYILDEEKQVVPATLKEWVDFMQDTELRRVKNHKIGDVRVSTVFLGNHDLFETMIFRGEHDQWQERCSTWQEAEQLHQTALNLVNK